MDINDRSKMVIALFHNERNQAFHHLMEERAGEFLVPAVERIVRQGIEEGIFNINYPTETTVAWVTMMRGLRKSMPLEVCPGEISCMTAAVQEISERLLERDRGPLMGSW